MNSPDSRISSSTSQTRPRRADRFTASQDTAIATDTDGSSRVKRDGAGDDESDDRDDGSDPDFDAPPPAHPHAPSAATTSPSIRQSQPAAASTSATDAGFRNSPIRRKRFGGLVWELENKGSVARDHLALERTFLAWLRTSLALASIGIAVTQLFRLPSGPSNVPSNLSPEEETTAPPPPSFLINSLATSSYPSLAALAPVFESQQAQLASVVGRNVSRFSHLAKPIGGTFIALALLFLILGTYRFYVVQAALVSEPSMFPPSRKTYGFGTFAIGALILATFAAILATV
ncbi:hypothetical protein JCM10908_005046 [Rhodotorula pacifica]|uniref:DUF202 domain-containing protein n=1 Tax=Rhodotorula pacifica TaxID=1495444 RepID=UPI00316ED9E7